MRRSHLVLIAALLALGLLLTAQAGARPDKKPAKGAKKVTICHRTSSVTNPYLLISVAVAAAKHGHAGHAEDIIPSPAAGCPTTPLTPTQGGQALTAPLTGPAEVPGPGDQDGAGSATIRLVAGEGRLCFQLSVTNLTLPATAAHVHSGVAGVAGPIVVTLTPPGAGGTASGCVTIDRTLVAAILANPAAYYVNMHTTDFPSGAVRGQL